MRYVDSGNRDPSQALGTWLGQTLQNDVTEIRWQSGFFVASGLGFFQESLRRLARENQVVRAVVGSNDQCTGREDIDTLVTLLGLPRSQAELGIVSYASGYYHPKTVHLRRQDGSQAAYVGSANLTESGMSSLHVEAGLTIDDREGDSTAVLDEIGAAVDFWFRTEPQGLYRVKGPEDVERLVTEGILSVAPQAPPIIGGTIVQSGRSGSLSRLRPLIKVPNVEGVPEPAFDSTQSQTRSIFLPATPRTGFPAYLLFAPGQSTPTVGPMALSGSSLPRGVAGLIIRLNRDTGRHFAGGSGTANISIPVATLSTFRFGIQAQGYSRPRAEFDLRLRYVSPNNSISLPSRTNIMAYGFIPGESGHGDVRMLVPATVKVLARAIRDAGEPLPEVGHVGLLEWPTMNEDSEFRLTFMNPRGELFRQSQDLLRQALTSGLTVGEGACWLPREVPPPWEAVER